jgi:hypothetical protein
MTGIDVPKKFWGLWRRFSVALDGGPPVEPALVFWCQAPRLFMDLRWHIDPQPGDQFGLSIDRYMAGYSIYEDTGFMTWHHMIDSLSGAGSDRSAVEVSGDELVERGEFDDATGTTGRTFIEVWRRVESEIPKMTHQTTDVGQTCTAQAGCWQMTIVQPDDPAEPARSELICTNGVSWNLGGTFAAREAER